MELELPDAEQLRALVLERASDQPRAWSTLCAVLADASAHAARDERLAPPERAVRAEAYAVAAVVALERAADAGYSGQARLLAMKELAPLHERADFQAALERIPR
jgi:hypothetical protein